MQPTLPIHDALIADAPTIREEIIKREQSMVSTRDEKVADTLRDEISLLRSQLNRLVHGTIRLAHHNYWVRPGIIV